MLPIGKAIWCRRFEPGLLQGFFATWRSLAFVLNFLSVYSTVVPRPTFLLSNIQNPSSEWLQAHMLDCSYARATKRGKEEKRKKNDGKKDEKDLCLDSENPFVSDIINQQIQRTLAKHDIPCGKTFNDLVKCPARNGSGITCNRKIFVAPSLCQWSNVAYYCHVLFMW